MLSNVMNESYLSNLEADCSESMEVMNMEATQSLQEPIVELNCFGTAGTLGTLTGCFGTAGTFGCLG